MAQEGFSSAASRRALGFNHAPLQWILGILFPEKNRPGVKMIIHLFSTDDNDLGDATDPCDFMEGTGNFASIQQEYIKTGSNFAIKFIIFLEIILKAIGV